VPTRLASRLRNRFNGNDSLESIPGPLKSFKIPSLLSFIFTSKEYIWDVGDYDQLDFLLLQFTHNTVLHVYCVLYTHKQYTQSKNL
jgi:hypothetical protein